MKQEFIFKELKVKDNINTLLEKGFFIVGQPAYNQKTNTIDYHLRRTLLSYLFRNFKRK